MNQPAFQSTESESSSKTTVITSSVRDTVRDSCRSSRAGAVSLYFDLNRSSKGNTT